MPELYDGDFLQGDLAALLAAGVSPAEVSLIEAFLDEVAGSEAAMWKLCRWSDEHQSPHFNCKAITWLHDRGYNIYRIRPLRGRLRKYRILYLFDPTRDEFHLLAIVQKVAQSELRSDAPPWMSYNYERDHPITERVIREYDERKFTKLRS